MKSVRIRSFSGPYYCAFGLNTLPFGLTMERYGVPLRIQSECWEMLSRKTPCTENIYAVIVDLLTVIKRILTGKLNILCKIWHLKTIILVLSFCGLRNIDKGKKDLLFLYYFYHSVNFVDCSKKIGFLGKYINGANVFASVNIFEQATKVREY